jgi:soluble lytic murein transglycosylase
VLATERLQFVPAVPMPDDPVLAKIPPLIRTEKEQLEEAPEDELRVEKSKLLENAGMFDSAMKELQAIPGKQHWATAEVARMYSEADQYHRALQILKRSVPQYFSLDYDDLPRQYWESLFPRPFWKDLKKFAEANELDPYLVASLIRQESEFNPGAVSRANALGLMQLLPSVGKSTARQLRVRGYSTNSLFVPSTNMQLGTKYFRMMVDKFGGQVEYALAAYNAGSNRVDDWMANGKYADIPEFVESIPFTETREYVQAIMRNAKVYKQLYPDERERASK